MYCLRMQVAFDWRFVILQHVVMFSICKIQIMVRVRQWYAVSRLTLTTMHTVLTRTVQHYAVVARERTIYVCNKLSLRRQLLWRKVGIVNCKYINCTSVHSQDTGSGHYVRWTVRAVVSTYGGKYVQWSVRTVANTCGGQYVWWSVRVVVSTCGCQYVRW